MTTEEERDKLSKCLNGLLSALGARRNGPWEAVTEEMIRAINKCEADKPGSIIYPLNDAYVAEVYAAIAARKKANEAQCCEVGK